MDWEQIGVTNEAEAAGEIDHLIDAEAAEAPRPSQSLARAKRNRWRECYGIFGGGVGGG